MHLWDSEASFMDFALSPLHGSEISNTGWYAGVAHGAFTATSLSCPYLEHLLRKILRNKGGLP